MLFLMSKIQNLKAIHNCAVEIMRTDGLFLMSKIQNLKAIHNRSGGEHTRKGVVSDVKDTKFESNSQPANNKMPPVPSCF